MGGGVDEKGWGRISRTGFSYCMGSISAARLTGSLGHLMSGLHLFITKTTVMADRSDVRLKQRTMLKFGALLLFFFFQCVCVLKRYT